MVLIETENQNKKCHIKICKAGRTLICENYNLEDINQRFQSFNAAVPSDFTKKGY